MQTATVPTLPNATTATTTTSSQSGRDRPSSDHADHAPMRCRECGTTSTPLWRYGPEGQKSLCNACGIRWKRANKYKLSSGIKKKKPEKKARHIVKTLPRRTDAERFSRFVETVESITSDDDFAGDDDDFVPNTPPERYERVYDSDSESRAASDNDRSPDDQTVAAWLYFIAQQTPQPMTA